jgi:hypothetical protein
MVKGALQETGTFSKVPGHRRGDPDRSPVTDSFIQRWEGARYMPFRVNPVVLLGLIIVSVLSIGVMASALSGGSGGGGTASDALAAAEGQLGKPFVMSTDGPDTFSCVGLMRYALRTAGVDPDAPWVPEEYLSRYAPVAPGDLQPGDIVIYPGWATMYAGNGQVINANEMEGFVTHTSMDVAGEPLGIVRPYGGQQDETIDPVTEPVPVEQQLPVDEQLPAEQQLPVDEQVPAEQMSVEQAPIEQAPIEQAPIEQAPIEQAPIEQAPVDLPAQV